MINYISSNIDISYAIDMTPVVSTAVNLTYLFLKAIRPLLPSFLQESRFFTQINDKSWGRCLTLSVPFLGNIAIFIYDRIQAANLKKSIPLYELGRSHDPLISKGPNVDIKKAMDYYQKAADLGNGAACTALGIHYKFVQNDDLKAVQMFQKGAALNQPVAMHHLAHYYYKGEVVPQNTKKAVELWKKSALQNYAPSLNDLAGCYEKGVGVETNPQKARQYWQAAAQLNYPEGKNNFAICLDEGYGGKKDVEAAVKLWEEAAQEGHADAMNTIAFCYDQGYGVAKDPQKAIQYWALASQRGHLEATKNLAICFENGEEVPKNPKVVEALRHKAIDLDPDYDEDDKTQEHIAECIKHWGPPQPKKVSAF